MKFHRILEDLKSNISMIRFSNEEPVHCVVLDVKEDYIQISTKHQQRQRKLVIPISQINYVVYEAE